MTTLKLSDLSGPDAAGWSDVAVFVRADGGQSEPFVFSHRRGKGCYIRYPSHRGPITGYREAPVRRLGRGRLVPARIEMEQGPCPLCVGGVITMPGPTKRGIVRSVCPECADKVIESLTEQVRLLRGALEPFAELDRNIGDEWQSECEAARNALAMTAPTMPADERLAYLCKKWGPALQAMADSEATADLVEQETYLFRTAIQEMIAKIESGDEDVAQHIGYDILAAAAPKMTACRTCGGSREVPLSREPCSTETVDCPDCTPTEDRK